MQAPEFQFVQFGSLSENCCEAILPVSSGRDIKFQYFPYSVLISGSEESISNFAEFNCIDIYSTEEGRGIAIQAVPASIMTGLDLKTVGAQFITTKAGTTTSMAFDLKEYNVDGTSTTILFDKLIATIVDPSPYFYNPLVVKTLEEQIQDTEETGGDFRNEAFTLRTANINIGAFEDESILIAGNTITAKMDCKVKLQGTASIYGHVDAGNLPPDDLYEWILLQYRINFGALQIASTDVSNLPDGSTFTATVVLNHEVTLLEGQSVSLSYDISTDKFMSTRLDANSWEFLQAFTPIDIIRTNDSLEDETGLYIKAVMVDENDEPIKVLGVDVINETFRRRNLNAGGYSVSIDFDNTTILADVPTTDFKFVFYELERDETGFIAEHKVSETELLRYIKNLTWLDTDTRTYAGMPFYRMVNASLEADKSITLRNNGLYDINILMSEEETIVVHPGENFNLTYTLSNDTWAFELLTVENYQSKTNLKSWVVSGSGERMLEIEAKYVGYFDLTEYDLSKILSVLDCFRIQIVEGENNIIYSTIFSYIGCNTEETSLLEFYFRENAMDFIGLQGENYIVAQRLPLILKNPQFAKESKVYTKRDGKKITLYSSVDRLFDVDIDYSSERFHECLVVALSADDILVNDEGYVFEENYEVDNENLSYDKSGGKLMKASAKAKRNISLRNANCK